MIDIIAVGLGGFIGSVLRYLIGQIPLSEPILFPIKTFMINIIGSALIGLIAVLMMKNVLTNQTLGLFLKVGICGGFTTFSSFALETSDIMQSGHPGIALLYVLLSVCIGVLVIYGVDYVTSI